MSTVVERKFDRLECRDERNSLYPVTSTAHVAAPHTVVWSCPAWLDQGSEGACVGYAFTHALLAQPGPVEGLHPRFAVALYHDAQRIDEFPGGAYAGADPHMEGTSVVAAAKVLNRRGAISAYRWAFSALELARGLVNGPAVLGIPWHRSMTQTDADGFVRPVGPLVGGHALLCRGYDAQRDVFVLRNSWGRRWGKDGDCFVTLEDMTTLFAKGGDACFPVKGAVKTPWYRKLAARICGYR